MKLRHLAPRESVTRITFSLKESDNRLLNHYVKYVAEQVGQELPTSDVVAASLKTHLEDDKPFQHWLKKQSKKEVSADSKKAKPEPKANPKLEPSQINNGGFQRFGFDN